MATFAELLADVHTITNRPDLVNETKLAVKMATLKAHHSDFFPKDLYETGISWATPDYVQSIEYRTLIPRYRALKYLRKYDNTVSPGVAGDFFTILTPDQVTDGYGIDKTNVVYLAGDMLELKSSTEDSYMILGCYLNPIVAEATFSSWIALDHPYLIVVDAARQIFKQIGQDQESAVYDKLTAEQYAELRLSNILANGY